MVQLSTNYTFLEKYGSPNGKFKMHHLYLLIQMYYYPTYNTFTNTTYLIENIFNYHSTYSVLSIALIYYSVISTPNI